MHVEFWWGISEGERTLGKPRRRRKNNIAVDVKGIGCVDVKYIHVSQDRELLAFW
jgi:hypothetical protein